VRDACLALSYIVRYDYDDLKNCCELKKSAIQTIIDQPNACAMLIKLLYQCDDGTQSCILHIIYYFLKNDKFDSILLENGVIPLCWMLTSSYNDISAMACMNLNCIIKNSPDQIRVIFELEQGNYLQRLIELMKSNNCKISLIQSYKYHAQKEAFEIVISILQSKDVEILAYLSKLNIIDIFIETINEKYSDEDLNTNPSNFNESITIDCLNGINGMMRYYKSISNNTTEIDDIDGEFNKNDVIAILNKFKNCKFEKQRSYALDILNYYFENNKNENKNENKNKDKNENKSEDKITLDIRNKKIQ
jgi:hypothetical protein